MYARKKLIAQLVTAAVAGTLLAGCGGGGGSGSAALTGVAAEGLAIANTTVTLKDANGNTRTATTNASGNFSISTAGLTAPFMLRVTGANGTYYTLVTSGDTGQRVNITNFTHGISLMALSAADDAALATAFNNGTFKNVTSTAIAAADTAFMTMLQDQLGTVPGVTNVSPRFATFTPATATQPGDEADRLLTFVKPLPGPANLVAAVNTPPEFASNITALTYDGTTDDLLTGGLGRSGLAAAAPTITDATSAAQLRRNAIHGNYRAIVDVTTNSGYGTMYGPNVDRNNVAGGGEGRVAGKEYIATFDNGSGRKNVTAMVQIPTTFDPDNPCIVTAVSSGSRGVYGAIGSAGEWGLRNGCAVAYSDKGSGTGMHTLNQGGEMEDMVNLRNGVRATASTAGSNAIYSWLDAARTAFATAFPNRVAFKHAHSQQNPERDWGQDTLDAVALAFYVLNEEYGSAVPGHPDKKLRTIKPSNTIVIASSVSNGAGAALLAAERDKLGLIDGIAGSEPQVQPNRYTGYNIQEGGTPVTTYGRTLFDYGTYAALYQPCIAGFANRCTSLVAKGLLTGADNAAQVADAKARLRNYGWTEDSETLQTNLAAATAFGVPGFFATFNANTNVLVAVAYAYAYGRFSPQDRVCGFSWANTHTDGTIIPFTDAIKATSFANMNGFSGNPVYEDSANGARNYMFGVSPSNNVADVSLDGFLCLRALATGADPVTGNALTGTLAEQSQRVRSGVAEVLANGNLRGKPAIIVHGRSDHLVLPNHSSRAYVGLNAAAEGANSKLRYIEVTNANHFDTLTPYVPDTLVPLHIYLFRALDAMYAHLKDGAALPPSQVVRTTTRADGSTALTNTHLPPILANPASGDRITVTGTTVSIPN